MSFRIIGIEQSNHKSDRIDTLRYAMLLYKGDNKMGFKVGDKVRLKGYTKEAKIETILVGSAILSKEFLYNGFITNMIHMDDLVLVEPCNETIIPYAIGQKVWAVTSEVSIDYKTLVKETIYSAEEFVIHSMIVHEDCITLFDENERKVGVVGKNVFTSKAEAQAECDKLNTPKVDWSKVAVDTPIWVRDRAEHEWEKRNFAKYEHGSVWAWDYGKTHHTALRWNGYTSWKFAKLKESDNE